MVYCLLLCHIFSLNLFSPYLSAPSTAPVQALTFSAVVAVPIIWFTIWEEGITLLLPVLQPHSFSAGVGLLVPKQAEAVALAPRGEEEETSLRLKEKEKLFACAALKTRCRLAPHRSCHQRRSPWRCLQRWAGG